MTDARAYVAGKLLAAYERVARRLPPPAAARLDLAVPSYRRSWGGPLNGQARRAELMRDLAAALPAAAIVETGTYRGTTTAFFATFGVPVYSVEANPRCHIYARRRLARFPNVELHLADSRTFLSALAARDDVPGERVLFYLDAHWEDDLPLRDELAIVVEGWEDSVVVVDDFRVPDDDGYGYDDYGAGRALTLEYLGDAAAGFTVLWPAAPSAEETGARRGCVVLADAAAAPRVADLPAVATRP